MFPSNCPFLTSWPLGVYRGTGSRSPERRLEAGGGAEAGENREQSRHREYHGTSLVVPEMPPKSPKKYPKKCLKNAPKKGAEAGENPERISWHGNGPKDISKNVSKLPQKCLNKCTLKGAEAGEKPEQSRLHGYQKMHPKMSQKRGWGMWGIYNQKASGNQQWVTPNIASFRGDSDFNQSQPLKRHSLWDLRVGAPNGYGQHRREGSLWEGHNFREST